MTLGRTLTAAALLAILALASAPSGTAAAPRDTTTTVDVEPFPGPLAPGESGTTRATVRYCYVQGAGALAADATAVRVKARLSHWDDAVGASVHPSTVHFRTVPGPIQGGWACAPEAQVNVTVTPWYSFRDSVAVILVAEAEENPPLNGSEGEAPLLVRFDRNDSAGSASVAESLSAPPPLAESGPVGLAALGALMAAAAGVLFLVGRRG